jgi:hypothetical protein
MLRIGLDDQNHQIWSSATAKTPAGVLIDISASTVHYAFLVPGARPVALDWKSGTWTDGVPSYSLTPLSIPLTVGLWDAWRKLTIGSMVIEDHVGQLTVI